jgi:hypothetical protein
MTTTLDINKLNFGSDDAELDEKNGFLDKVFLNTSIYDRTKRANRELIIGRKGSGKSAIFLMLKKALQSEGVPVIPITPQSLSHQKIAQLKISSINEDESYILSWKYVLLVKVALEVLYQSKKPSSSEQRRILKLIRKFLVENGEINKNFFEKLFKSVGIFSKLSINVLGTGVAWESHQQEAYTDAADELDRFQSRIETLLTSLNGTKIFVLIDKVDEVWNQTKESQTMIIGLIKAIHDLNSLLHHTHIILFLRSDIYDVLTFNDSDKFHSLEERLIWDENDLKHLIANRGKVSANLGISDVDDLWNIIFSKFVRGEPTFQYILKRTMMRPRELIQFCNNSLSEAQNKGHKLIFTADILEAEKLYSDWKLKDLANEFFVQYPYLKELLGLFQGFKAEFSREEFNIRYQEAQAKLTQYSDLQSTNTDTMLQILFIIGFLGVRLGTDNIFAYENPSIVLAQQKYIVIHPAFHLALGLQKVIEISGGERNIVIGRDNVVGSVLSGGSVNLPSQDIRIMTIRQLESLQTDLSILISQQIQTEEEIKLREPDVPSRLKTRLRDIEVYLAETIIKIARLEAIPNSEQNTQKISDAINTLKSKVVLILGRFTSERKAILYALKDELRKHDFTPVLFDFEKPSNRDLTETMRTLAHLSRFIIVDLTEPSSIPQELQAIVPDLEIPVQPLLLEAKREYSMFVDFRKYHWVLPVYLYKDQASLNASIRNEIIEPADKKARELAIEKAKRLKRP